VKEGRKDGHLSSLPLSSLKGVKEEAPPYPSLTLKGGGGRIGHLFVLSFPSTHPFRGEGGKMPLLPPFTPSTHPFRLERGGRKDALSHSSRVEEERCPFPPLQNREGREERCPFPLLRLERGREERYPFPPLQSSDRCV
jgi:hypothetical protein